MNILKEIILNQLIRIPLIQKIAKNQHLTGRNNDPIQAKAIFEKLNEYTKFEGKSVIELGPGQTFGVLEKVLEANALKVCAADIMTYVENIPDGIEYHQYDGTNLPFDDNLYDVLWSWSVFEHIRYPNITVPETYRILKSGGFAIHAIDLVDHFNYTWKKDELTFNCLKYPEWLWDLMTWNRSNYVNRLRINDWLNLFIKEGFKIIHYGTIENNVIKMLHSDHKIEYLKKYTAVDASTMSFFIVLQK